MASLVLLDALRRTARKLEEGAPYMWGHMGACNCGNLAQELTRLTQADIHAFAMARSGDWREQVEEYCPVSGLPIDLLIADLLQYGLTTSDLQHLEWLSDPKIKQRIPKERRDMMRHNCREDVVLYLRTWAEKLEEELLDSVALENLSKDTAPKTPSLAH
ncbi:hypothetical protein [Siphonobacter aquaeclarae]|uniref:DUF5069 domain-containing protein n=1 Tax=Siphonobacter aquaeclarae TaxID=563176 RepID=A0A1G9PYP5_9BACT|nr:hypothetical protein [Siphonobacter aquaeclarae]SDM03879.1 hypothetical protein SAMN04488090_2384 [Siphonobacter aquaeclarae]